jgi:hypothetical protein
MLRSLPRYRLVAPSGLDVGLNVIFEAHSACTSFSARCTTSDCEILSYLSLVASESLPVEPICRAPFIWFHRDADLPALLKVRRFMADP